MRNDAITPIQSLSQLSQGSEPDFLQIAGTLWRGKWLIAIVCALAVFAGGYYAFALATPRYTSTTVMALESRDSQVLDFDSVVSGLSADTATVNTEVEVLRARILLGKLVDQMNLEEDPEFNRTLRPESIWSLGAMLRRLGLTSPAPPPNPRAVRDMVVDTLLESISIVNVRNSYVFRISVRTTDAVKSAQIADALAELYISDQLVTKFQATERATDWLAQQVSELQIKLEAAETRVKDYNSSIDLVGPETLAALNHQLKDTRTRLADSERALAGYNAQLAAMERARATGDPTIMAEAAGDDSLIAAAGRATEDQEARATFDQRFDDLLGRVRLVYDRETALNAVLRASVTEIETKVDTQSADLVKLQQLEREAAASGLIYEYFLSRLNETSVQQGIQQADARVLSYAVVADQPSQPRKGQVLLIAALLGIVLGAVLVLLREMRQTGFRSAEDMERATGVTVVGQIPRAPSTRRKRLLDYIVSKPTSALAEAVRNLRTSILLSNVDQPPKLIVLTSSVPGEGKTTQSISLAHNLAGLGRKVLIVEGDVRRRTFREYFDIKGKRGLLSAVNGDVPLKDVVWHNDKLGVDLLVGEESNVNAADFFSSEKFAAFIKSLRATYDVVLIDTPPVLVVPDARVIAQHADAVLYVVHWDKTPRSQVERGLHEFATVNISVTGLVLSQIDAKGMKRYGGRYREAYASHGGKYYKS